MRQNFIKLNYSLLNRLRGLYETKFYKIELFPSQSPQGGYMRE